MVSLYHFLRLIRLTNLLVIALCMGVFQVFITKYVGLGSGIESYPGIIEIIKINVFYQADFLLLVLSTTLIAAAGNVINDYFDVKADRINKPNRLIVGRHIKRRWAMFLHWTMSSAGTLIAFYLSWKTNNWWIGIVSVISVNILWFYSSIYKRKFLSGNLMIASLLGIVPVYVLVFHLPFNNVNSTYINLILKVVIMLAGIAFLINLIREFVKDIADRRGDLKLGARTLPIVLGLRKTKTIVTVLIIGLLVAMTLYTQYVGIFVGNRLDDWISNDIFKTYNFSYFIYAISLAGICSLIAIFLVLSADKRKKYILASDILKLAMLFGLMSPLFL